MIRSDKQHVFFYTEWLSNFRRTSFEYDYNGEGNPHRFFCTEQAFMYCKARFFNDLKTADEILTVETPQEAKELGRQVRNYVDSEWDKVRYNYMRDVNLERFRQDEFLNSKILNPEYDGKVFVEASPVDRIWGIGLPLESDFIFDESKWTGRNLLGKALTEVRSIIKEENK